MSTESPTLVAARNNAHWCDIVCRMHGVTTVFDADAWVSTTRTPPGYPDAVTLRPDVAADRLLARVDASPGCSVKDSFATLDLAAAGFSVLFEAEWIHRPAEAAPPPATALRWQPVTTADGLVSWAAAHGSGAVFGPALLDAPSVVVLCATGASGGIAGGVIGNHQDSVVGLSNLFTVAATPEEVWAGAVAALSAWRPGLALVGYEHGTQLAAARRAGFASTGPLRVWLRPL